MIGDISLHHVLDRDVVAEPVLEIAEKRLVDARVADGRSAAQTGGGHDIRDEKFGRPNFSNRDRARQSQPIVDTLSEPWMSWPSSVEPTKLTLVSSQSMPDACTLK